MAKLLVGNWKMYPTLADALVLAATIRRSLEELKGVEVVIAPPTAWLPMIIDSWHHRTGHIHFAAQNVYPDDQGAYTGEISAYLLRSMVDYAIVGHSERRRYQGEDNELVNRKVHSCLTWKIKPILCVGESKPMFDASHRLDSYQWSKVAEQLMEGLAGVKADDLGELVIAYEPVWAVGTKRPATAHYALEAIGRLKEKLHEKYPKKAIASARFIYGGSVEPGNAADFLKYAEIEGVLPGAVSVKARDFIEIAKIAAAI